MIVVHCSRAADGQHFVAVPHPGDVAAVCAAFAAVHHCGTPHLHRQQRRRQHQRQHKTDKLLHIPVLLFLSCTRGKKRETPLTSPAAKSPPAVSGSVDQPSVWKARSAERIPVSTGGAACLLLHNRYSPPKTDISFN